jgi:quaternary ammonium compound-resistance protein SugE
VAHVKRVLDMPWNWAVLVVAGLLEVGWAIGLKYTDGFTRFWPTVATILAMVMSMGLLGLAVKTLPVGTAYAVWVGIGTVGTVVLGIFLLGESVTVLRLLSLSLIIAGIIGLKLATPSEQPQKPANPIQKSLP